MTNVSRAIRLYAVALFAGSMALALAFGLQSYDARRGPWMVLSAAALVCLEYSAYQVLQRRLARHHRHVEQMSDLHLATIEALVVAIDAKDDAAQRRLRRMRLLAARLAEALGMSATDIQGVMIASLLHDIGKLAVPEHILAKPGPLTQEEFHKIRVHPQIGADIIGRVPFPYPVAPLILCHHERWNGKGYPAGIAGDEIPLGARILSVVDYFDALISDDSSGRAMSAEQALELLQQESGKALDPRVVREFVIRYPTLAREVDTVQQTSPVAIKGVLPGPPTYLEPQSKVLQDIALAHREIYALYEIAQSLGGSLGIADTMALISSKLRSLIPFSCCALFLRGDAAAGLTCVSAAGTDAELLEQLTIPYGQGLSGWVARHRRSLVNARPRTDLVAAGRADSQTSLESALACPLVFDDRCIGTLSLYHTQAGIYTDDHCRLLDRVSLQAAAVIYHSVLFEQTQKASLTDPLTGLPNTRSMFMHLTRELTRADRLGTELALLVLDLDRFKDINDTHGHHVGDRALREVGATLQRSIRPYDICVRYAGDEFIVVLAGCGAEEAEQKRRDLQQAVAELSFEAGPGRALALAISVGAAVYPRDGGSYEALMATADARMYADKARRTRRSDPLTREQPPAASA